MTKPRKLVAQPIPIFSWKRNVRAVVSSEVWHELRWFFGATLEFRRTYWLKVSVQPSKSMLTCAYCDAHGAYMELHEEWAFNDAHQIQQLIGLAPACPRCHLAMHIGHANVTGKTDEAIEQFVKVNGWTRRQAREHCKQALARWGQRMVPYELDLSYLEQYVPPERIHLEWLDHPKTWIGNRLDAIVWAQELLRSDALILDTETTGLPKKKRNVEVIELAVIDMKGRPRYQSLFKPRYRIPQKTINIHGITNAQVRRAPRFASEWPSISSLLGGQTIVVYNAAFDRAVLRRTCELHGTEWMDARWECAMHAYRWFMQSPWFLKLEGTHRAAADCKAVLALLRKMARADVIVD